MGRFKFVSVGVALAVLTGVWMGAGPASGGTSIHVLYGPGGADAFLDQNRSGLRLGDSLAARGPLLDPTTNDQVGSAYVSCWVARALIHERGLFDCTSLL